MDFHLRRVYSAGHLLLLRLIDLRHISRLRSAHNQAGQCERSITAAAGDGYSGRLSGLARVVCGGRVLGRTLLALHRAKLDVGSDVGGLFQAIRRTALDGEADEVHHARRGGGVRWNLRCLGARSGTARLSAAVIDVAGRRGAGTATGHLHNGRHVSMGARNGELSLADRVARIVQRMSEMKSTDAFLVAGRFRGQRNGSIIHDVALLQGSTGDRNRRASLRNQRRLHQRLQLSFHGRRGDEYARNQ